MKITFDSEEQMQEFIDSHCPYEFGYERRICGGLAAGGCKECLGRYIEMEVEEGGKDE